MFFFAWIGYIFTAVLKGGGYLEREMTLDLVDQTSLGIQASLPDMVGGWPITHAANFALLAVRTAGFVPNATKATRGVSANGIPPTNTYAEWHESPFSARGVTWQNCHRHESEGGFSPSLTSGFAIPL